MVFLSFRRNNYSKIEKALRKKFDCVPIAVRLVFEGEDVRGEVRTFPKICNAIAKAESSFILPLASLSCPVAKFMLRGEGKDEIVRKLVEEGVTSETEAKNLVSHIPHFKGNIFGLQIAPLSKSKFEPDVVIFILTPKDAMKLAQSLSKGSFIRADFNGVTASCSEIIAIPIKERRPNISLGCRGSRRFIDDDKLFFSIPASMLYDLIGDANE